MHVCFAVCTGHAPVNVNGFIDVENLRAALPNLHESTIKRLAQALLNTDEVFYDVDSLKTYLMLNDVPWSANVLGNSDFICFE